MSNRRQTGDTRKITLAHPLSAEQAKTIGVDSDKDFEVGDTIDVPAQYARTVITSGYAQVDPEDPEAVAAVVGEDTPSKP